MQSNIEIRENIKVRTSMFGAVRRSCFPTQVRQMMIERGITVDDVAIRLGISDDMVKDWLRGDRNLGIDAMYQLVDALGEHLTITIGSCHN